MTASRAAEYAAEVQKNVEAAIHAAGFPGYYQPGALTVECLARISAAIGVPEFEGWFPSDDAALGSERSASARTDRHPAPRRSSRARRSLWRSSPSEFGLGVTG